MLLQREIAIRVARTPGSRRPPPSLGTSEQPDLFDQSCIRREILPRSALDTGSDVAGAALHRRYVAMMEAFEATGGVASGDEVASWARSWADQPLSLVARWVVRREITHFKWRGMTCIPMFQFDVQGRGRREGLQEAISQLACAFDDWEMAEWFGLPNVWLGNVSPASVLPHDPAAVISAACADRFVAMG